MVAQEILDLLVWVRVLVPEPFLYVNGAMVKRLRRRPLKAKSWVRFPLALPIKILSSWVFQELLFMLK
jgi:hypothetical protein